jgi:hypothetical protein
LHFLKAGRLGLPVDWADAKRCPICPLRPSWKAAVTHAFHPFMDFYFPDFSAHIDWKQRPRFRDKELAAFGLVPRRT